MTFQDLRSGLPLPSLVALREMPPREREEALQGWVVWLDANRHRVSTTVERLLDRALRDLREDAVQRASSIQLDAGYREWLQSAGEVGRGRTHGDE